MSDTKFIVKDNDLYLKYGDYPERKVIRGFESYNGFYHFATGINFVVIQKADGTEEVKEYPKTNTKMPKLEPGEKVTEIIFYGFCQVFYDEWGTFSLSELQEVMKTGKEWEIPKKNLPHSGRRD